jgi:hypothetical protein
MSRSAQRFEYRRESFKGEIAEGDLNKMGDKGWELVAADRCVQGSELHFNTFWKRPVYKPTPRLTELI